MKTKYWIALIIAWIIYKETFWLWWVQLPPLWPWWKNTLFLIVVFPLMSAGLWNIFRVLHNFLNWFYDENSI